MSNALEILGARLGDLIDSEVDIPERVRKATLLVGAGLETHEEAVAALVVSDDPWLRSCAAYAIGSLAAFWVMERLAAAF
jgi:hypothetical protein